MVASIAVNKKVNIITRKTNQGKQYSGSAIRSVKRQSLSY